MNNKSLESYLETACASLSYGEALAKLVLAAAKASIELAHLLAKSNLTGDTEKLSNKNVQGEYQMRLDVISNDIFVKAFKASNVVAGIVSEELEDAVIFNIEGNQYPFLVAFDPLDGSSNIAVNGIVGSIFSILPAPIHGAIDAQAFLQAGKSQLAALYVIYGPATMLVISIGNGTQAFTLDAATNTFYLTQANINISPQTSEFAINASNERFWEKPIIRYIAECLDGKAGLRARDFNMRWTASMVADVHRILMRGGVFLYPKDNKQPTKAGRLRLLYEANPMSMLVEQAHGKSSTGRMRILDIQPTEIHERVAVILGSEQEVSLIAQYHQLYDQQKG
ncbi:MAG TPA: class 1 fructose-bisphosphatase [Methylotenera sp.]|nr:class 1 fructose-bisphosphatase [Methylotenera sp.]HPH06655.1 class 1 fructose-bisphosphatase [Methylotenera sp.]HPN01702.1 class 1 fructose-bisphosphatase [Methylotenera sp.]